MKRIICLVLALFITSSLLAQSGRVSGKVINEKNEPLAGVSIQVKGTTRGVASGVDGNFTLALPAGKYVLVFTALGYTTKTITDVEVGTTGITDLSVVLASSNEKTDTVTVRSTSSARRETVNAAISYQRNTNTVASVVSAEAIRRSPDRNTGEVLKRTPGASIQEGKFLVVRGLADRYNQAMLNGILLTSTEPDRKTFSFDLIPAAMIDNIVINKAFVPEYPGEWAGGLIQVNTKDIPAKGFFNLQIGTGFNTQSSFRPFYKDGQGGKWDWLGIDDGTRALPSSYTTKTGFDTSSSAQKIAIGKQLRNSWLPKQVNAAPNFSFQANGGFNTKFLSKTVGGTFGLIYSRNNRYIEQQNKQNILVSENVFSTNFDLQDDRYAQDISWGALGSLSFQFDQRNRVSVKSLLNVNSSDAVTDREGRDFTRNEDLKGNEFNFKQNIFTSTQISGDHKLDNKLSLKWFGSFNILDGHVPDQRRLLFFKSLGSSNPYELLLSGTNSQISGSRIYQDLSDYIYTAGGDINYSFDLFGKKQSVKAGYMVQVKDRLYDAKLFANNLPKYNPAITFLPADQIFVPSNYSNGDPNSNLLTFDAIKNSNFRYMANTILNAGFVQFDNAIGDKLRAVWGVRVEDYDQLIGSVKTWDPRHQRSVVRDYLPGLNITYKLNRNNNIRFSASQTVIRPELRELSFLNLYDFELNASVQGEPDLQRTKVTNFDLRYELYPKAGEMLTVGAFYKRFKNPIEQLLDEGIGGASTFSYVNAEKATSYGVELELRKQLDFISLKNMFFHMNGAYIHSRVTDATKDIDRPMQGQSAYLINAGLTYDFARKGFTATMLFNYIGERIYVIGNLQAGGGSPNVYEAPRPVLDLQFSKKVLKNRGEFRLNISDLINQTLYFYQNGDDETNFQKNKDAIRFSRKFGTTFNLTFNYSFVK